MSKGSKWVVATIVATTLLALPAAATAVWAGKNGKVAFASGRDGGDASADIYFLAKPNGTVTGPNTPLLTGQHRHPNWSPVGDQITFALFNGASSRDIWIANVGQTGASVFTLTSDQQEDRPAWSPDGKFIAYESEEPPNCPMAAQPCDQYDIYIKNVKTGNVVNLTGDLTNSEDTIEGKPVWSPNGKWIYYHSDRFGDFDIFRERSDNSQSVPQNIFIPGGDQSQVSLSPDGRQLCFLNGTYGGNDTDIRTVASDGTGVVTDVSDNTGNANPPFNADYNCAWSPDGTRIAFSRGTFTNGDLYSTASDDSDTPTLLTPPGDADLGMMGIQPAFDGNSDWARKPLRCDGRKATVVGTVTHDNPLNGTNDRDIIVALRGDDNVLAKDGNDVACGSEGDDHIDGGDGNDTCIGGPGADTFTHCESIKP